MSYLIIDDFRLGMDRRKQRVSGVPGALWAGINGHITRGGDFERRNKFVKKYVLPAGLTLGLAQVGQQLYAFGAGTTPVGMPAAINYQQLASPTSSFITKILDITTFSSKLYVVAQFNDGTIYHYYDGARVTAWDTIATANSSNTVTAAAFAARIGADPRYIVSSVGSVVTLVAAVAGTAFTISSTAVNGGATNDQTFVTATPQANVPGVPETRASMTLQITGGSRDTSITLALPNAASIDVSWSNSNEATAQALVNGINTLSTVHGLYTASAVGALITIQAPAGFGASGNGDVQIEYFSFDSVPQGFSISVNGAASSIGPADGIDSSLKTYSGAMAGGINDIPAVAQVSTLTVGGTVEALDQFTATIDGVAYVIRTQGAAMGTTALTYFGKVYSVLGSLVYFSAIAGPTDWSGTGSGFISIVNQDSDSEGLVGLRQFQGRMAIFSRFNTQIWVLTVDPANNTFQQSVQNTGALSSRSLLQYGNIDTFYFSDSGVRSMRARDASNAPSVNDIGVAIDTFIQQFTGTLSGQQIARACAAIVPGDDRYWLAIHNWIFVYSFFEGSKINAWTYYDLTDEIGSADITEIVRAGKRMWLRAGDNVYLYGGDDNNIYPNKGEIITTLALPFLSGNKPGTIKGVKGFDCGISGTWDAFLQPDPDDDTQMIPIGTFGKSTYNLNSNPIENPSPLVAITMTCDEAGYASVSNLVIHFDVEDEK